MIFKALSYGIKNFYKELGLSQHFSFRGLLRRWERQRPLLFRMSKFVLVYTLITTSSMMLLPGTILPLQKQFKLFAVARVEQICRLWYLSLVADQVGYVSAIYRLIFYLISQGIEDELNIAKYLNYVNQAVTVGPVGQRTSNHAHIQNISHSVLLLKKILINYEKNNKNRDLLKSRQFASKINDVYSGSAVGSRGKIDQIDKSNFVLCLKLIEYLLKFDAPEKKLEILSNFKQILEDENKKFVIHLLLMDDPLKKQLKRIYSENSECRPIIIKILDLVEEERKRSIV